jgi:hypothetical protein
VLLEESRVRVLVDRVAFELHLALPFVGRGGVARACARADEQHVERLWWLEIGILQPRWWCAQRMRSEWVVHAMVRENKRRVLVVGGWRLTTPHRQGVVERLYKREIDYAIKPSAGGARKVATTTHMECGHPPLSSRHIVGDGARLDRRSQHAKGLVDRRGLAAGGHCDARTRVYIVAPPSHACSSCERDTGRSVRGKERSCV